jgi:hypothetical protein
VPESDNDSANVSPNARQSAVGPNRSSGGPARLIAAASADKSRATLTVRKNYADAPTVTPGDAEDEAA